MYSKAGKFKNRISYFLADLFVEYGFCRRTLLPTLGLTFPGQSHFTQIILGKISYLDLKIKKILKFDIFLKVKSISS